MNRPTFFAPIAPMRWWTRSDRDPRFNLEGHAASYWEVMHDAREAIVGRAVELSCRIPNDIRFGGGMDGEAAA